MGVTDADPPGRRFLRRRVAPALALAALLLALATGLWSAAFRLSAEERQFVGRWRMESPAYSQRRPELACEVEFTAGRAVRNLIVNTATGEVEGDETLAEKWRLARGELGEVLTAWDRLPARLGGSTRPPPSRGLEWDGPDRFRLTTDAATGRAQVWRRLAAR